MASIAKLNIEKATARQLFMVVVKATDEINEVSFTHGQNKRRFKVDIMAQGSEFYLPDIFRYRIAVTAKGYPDISTWSYLELVNTKAGGPASSRPQVPLSPYHKRARTRTRTHAHTRTRNPPPSLPPSPHSPASPHRTASPHSPPSPHLLPPPPFALARY